MGKVMRALGLMSGTSLDGIDVALIDTDGEDHVVRGPAETFSYSPEMRELLVHAIADAKSIEDRHDRPGFLPRIERALTDQHGAAVSEFLQKHSIKPEDIGVIGFHGQTVLHRPDTKMTVQLGLGEVLADVSRCPVVYDLRAADVAAGGQGAPLVPVYHRALAAKISQRPVAIVNIGGVANITWIGRDGQLVAFDTGPGNALIDDWMRKSNGQLFDEGGSIAAKGTVNDDVLSNYLSQPFFKVLGPKSLDRNAFDPSLVDRLSAEDGAATLTAFTARSIALAGLDCPERPELWIICGGGRRNKTLMAMLAGLVEAAVVPAEAAGLNGDSLEAEAWAYLAVRSLKNLPITYPGTTGVPAPQKGGIVVKPRS
jgi:anhydro-N-acetylmuramic acid kinase